MENVVFTQLSIPEIRTLLREELETYFSSKQFHEPAIPAGDQFLNLKQAAALVDLKTSSVYGLVHEKKIPVHKRGKRLYFSKQELMDIKSGRKQTLQEIDRAAADFIKNPSKKKRGAL